MLSGIDCFDIDNRIFVYLLMKKSTIFLVDVSPANTINKHFKTAPKLLVNSTQKLNLSDFLQNSKINHCNGFSKSKPCCFYVALSARFNNSNSCSCQTADSIQK